MNLMRQLILFICLFASTTAQAELAFDWKNLFYTYLKIQPDYDYSAQTASYMKLFKADVWEQYENDEFELENQKQLAAKEFKQQVESFNKTDDEFALYINLKFGKYDFENGVFPIEGLKKNSYFSERLKVKRYIPGGMKFPATFHVFFANPEKLGSLKMNKAQAKAFLDGRKSRSGYVDRKLPTMLHFKIVGKYKDKQHAMVALLTKVIVYQDKSRKTILEEF